MSLINKMLNELEKNKKSEDPARTEILSSINLTNQKHKAALEKKIIILVLILGIVISIFFSYRATIINNTTISKLISLPKTIFTAPKKPQVTTATVAQPPTKKVVPATTPTVKLKNIILQTANAKTVIDFVLSATTLYYIEHSADQQQLFITLSNTGLLGNVPIALENSFITALNTQQRGMSTICTLTLLPGTKVDELQLIDKPQPLLHLVLSNPQLTNRKMLKIPIPVSLEQQQEQRYQDIQQLLAQNNNQAAITQLRLFLGDFSPHLQARETLVGLLIKEGAWQKADNILTVGLDKNPNYAPFIKLKARIFIAQNKIPAALNLLQQFSTTFAEDPEYLALLATLYQQQNQFMAAAELYNQLTKIQPQKAIWWVGLAIALESADKKNAAKEAYNHAYNSLETTPELMAFLADKTKQ